MKELLITWKGVFPHLSSGHTFIQRVYRWGIHTGRLNKLTNEWTVEQRRIIQEEPLIELCKKVERSAPPATIDDGWEETVIHYGTYQSIEGSLLQIRISSNNYKKQFELARSLGFSIDSSKILALEKELQDEVQPNPVISLLPLETLEALPTLPAVSRPVPRPVSRPAPPLAQPAPPLPQPAPLLAQPVPPLASRVPLLAQPVPPLAQPAVRVPPPAARVPQPAPPPAARVPPPALQQVPQQKSSSLSLPLRTSLNHPRSKHQYMHADRHFHSPDVRGYGGVRVVLKKEDSIHQTPSVKREESVSKWLGT